MKVSGLLCWGKSPLRQSRWNGGTGVIYFSKQMSLSRAFIAAEEAGRTGATPRSSRPGRDVGLPSLIAMEVDDTSLLEPHSVREHVLRDMQNEAAALTTTPVTSLSSISFTTSVSSSPSSPLSSSLPSSIPTPPAHHSTTTLPSLTASSSSDAIPARKRVRVATSPVRLLFEQQDTQNDASTLKFKCLLKPEVWEKGGNVHNVVVTCPPSTLSNLKRHAKSWHHNLWTELKKKLAHGDNVNAFVHAKIMVCWRSCMFEEHLPSPSTGRTAAASRYHIFAEEDARE
jgi:hypothetical protein